MKERDTRDQPVLSDTVHCPYSCPGIVLTHPAKLFLDPSQFVFVIPASHEVLLPENSRRVQVQPAAGRDSRGPPSLTL